MWSKQAVNKRNAIIKQKLERDRKNYNDKVAKIEEIKRKKSAERSNKAKSP